MKIRKTFRLRLTLLLQEHHIQYTGKVKVKVKTKSSLCLTKYHTMKTFLGKYYYNK